jgi:ABC-type glycerol-3-phosphate transport system substrate-binding protein
VKRKSVLFVLAFLLVALICFGGGAQEAKKASAIKYWDIQPGQNLVFKESLIKKFEQENPQYTIDFSNLPYQEAHTKLITAIQTGDVPDTAYVQTQWIGEFGAMGALENLEPYVSGWAKKNEVMDLSYVIGRKYKNTLYTIPTEFMIPALFYRSDWLKEKGFAGPPKTWAEFLKVAIAFTEPEKNRYGFAMRGALGCERYYLMFMIMANQGKIFDDAGNCILNNQAGKNALKSYGELFTKYKVCSDAAPNNSYMEMVAEFSSGVAGTYIHNNYSISKQTWNFLEKKAEGLPTAEEYAKASSYFGTTPIPAGPYGTYVFVFANTHPIFAKAKNKEGTWEFIKFLLDAENDLYWASNLGALPVNRKNYESEWFKTNPFLPAFKEELNASDRVYQYPEDLPGWGALTQTVLVEEFQKGLLGKQSWETAADNIAAAITKVKKEAK